MIILIASLWHCDLSNQMNGIVLKHSVEVEVSVGLFAVCTRMLFLKNYYYRRVVTEMYHTAVDFISHHVLKDNLEYFWHDPHLSGVWRL